MHAHLINDMVSGVQEAFQSTVDTSTSFAPPPSLAPIDKTDDTSLTTTVQMNAKTDNTVLSMQQQILQLQQMVNQMQANHQVQPQQQN